MDRPDLPRPEPMTEPWQWQRLFDGLSRAIVSVPRPLLLILDDLQWCDRDTLDWLYYLLRAHAEEKLLITGTLRTEEVPDNPAVADVLTHLRALDRLLEIDLGPLNEAETTALATHVAKRNLDAQVAAELFRRTEGHPLFVVEMARAEPEGATSVPPRVQAVITARLSRLSPPAGDLHDRVREAAYGEAGPAARRLLHKRVAQALELIHGADLDRVSAQLAAHYEQAGQTARAVHFYRRAAEVAARVSASGEAIRHLSRALALLRDLPPDRERDREELAIQLAIAAPAERRPRISIRRVRSRPRARPRAGPGARRHTRGGPESCGIVHGPFRKGQHPPVPRAGGTGAAAGARTPVAPAGEPLRGRRGAQQPGRAHLGAPPLRTVDRVVQTG